MRKSQATMEIVFVIGILLFLFILLAASVYEKRSETRKTSSALTKSNLCYEVANNIASVYNGGDGATARITSLNYNISIDPPSRLIKIINRDDEDDYITCTIPVEKVLYYDSVHNRYNGTIGSYIASLQGYNNSFYPNFNINATSIQLENIDGRVFINSRCNINEIDFAEAQSNQGFYIPTTLPVRRFDNNSVEVVSGTRSEEPGTGQYKFNVAYAKLGDYRCILGVLQQLGYIGTDECQEYQSPSCSTPQTKCDIFKSTSVIDKCLFNPTKPDFTEHYTIIIYEDVQNLDSTQLSVYEERISNGAWALLSGKILTSATGYAFESYLYTNTPNGGAASLIQQDPEGLLASLTRDPITFTGTGSSGNLAGLTNYYTLYRFNAAPQNDAVARWKYPDTGEPHGDVYYFNNYCDMLTEIEDLLRNILSISYFTYIQSDFRISRTINESLQANNPVTILVAHNIGNPSYSADYAWIGEVSWCNLDTDVNCASWNVLEIDENGYLEGTTNKICENLKSEYNKPKVAKCTFELGSASVNNIKVRIKFINSEGAGQVPVTIDFIQLEDCYSE